MEEDMKTLCQDDFIERMKCIYNERDAEFTRRESAYQKKYEMLQKLTLEMSEERNRINAEKTEIKDVQEQIRQQKESLEQKQKEVEKREQELIFKNNLALEEMRNEEMKCKRLREEYEYKISLIDHNLIDLETEMEVDSQRYMLRTEYQEAKDKLQADYDEALNKLRKGHDENIQRMQREHAAEVENLNQAKCQLEKDVERLQEERVSLLKQNLELSGKLAELTPIPEAGADDDVMLEDAAIGTEMIEESMETADISTEELTASVLKSYIEKNMEQFCNLEIRHSDNGEQLHAESGGLQFHFLFSRPARFDIVAKRKNSAALRRKLAEMNNRHPEVKFLYEAGEVCATGYFTNDLSAYQLMKQVETISDCFKQNS